MLDHILQVLDKEISNTFNVVNTHTCRDNANDGPEASVGVPGHQTSPTVPRTSRVTRMTQSSTELVSVRSTGPGLGLTFSGGQDWYAGDQQ